MSAQEARQGHLRLVECVSCHSHLQELSVAYATMESQKAAIDAMARRLEQLEDGEDMKHLEKELRKFRRTVGILNAELAKARKEDPKYADALELFEYWRIQTGRSNRTKLTEDREKALLKALRNYSKRYIALAVLGAKHCAHVSETTGERFDDVELLCRGSKTEKFVDRYHRFRERQGLPPVPEVVDPAAGVPSTDGPAGGGTDESGTAA